MERYAITELPLVHSKKIRHIVWNHGGNKLVSCGDDKLVCVWDAEKAVLRQSLSGHGSRVTCGCWSMNDQLATCSRDHAVIVWDLFNGTAKFVFRFNNALSSIQWCGQDNLIIGDEKGNLFVGKVEHGVRFDKIHNGESQVVEIARSENHGLIFVAHADGLVLVFSDEMKIREKLQFDEIRGFAVGDDMIAMCGNDSKVVCRSLPDLTPAFTLSTTASTNHSVAFDGDGKQLVAFGESQIITRWFLDAPTHADGFPAARTKSRIKGVAFHPHLPKLALVGRSQKRISLLDLGPVVKDSQDCDPSTTADLDHCDILVVTANPKETTPLSLQSEAEKIKNCFESAPDNQHTIVVAKHATGINELRRCLHQMRPRIVHFAGHGDESGNLMFQSKAGAKQEIDPKALSDLLREFPSIEVVTLNACYSAHAAELLAEHIDCVVGMGHEIEDGSALQFALAFYEALAYGKDFATAFRLGCNAIELLKLPDAEWPMAFLPGIKVNSASKLKHRSIVGKTPTSPQSSSPIARSGESTATRSGSDTVSVKLWFGTLRKLKVPDSARFGFGGTRDDKVNYGTCEVVIPKRRNVGSLGSSSWWRLIKWNDDRIKLDNNSIELMDPMSYWGTLKQTIADLDVEEKHALVFIHGYNVSFGDAARRTAQIAVDLPLHGPSAFFSWPSKARLFGYLADEATIKYTTNYLAQFLTDFVRESGAQRIHLIAHSMGNRGLLNSIEQVVQKVNQEQPFDQIFLAAPDVDVDVFGQKSKVYQRAAKQVTLYVSRRDKAVWLSRLIHDQHRLGYYSNNEPPRIFPSIDTIRVKSDFDLFDLGHGYVASEDNVLADMHQAIQFGAKPSERRRLTEKEHNGNAFWELNVE